MTYRNFQTWGWDPTVVMLIYGSAIFINLISFLITYTQFYSIEIKKGTIRSVSLYPLSMNGITIAKILSSSLTAFISSTLFFVFMVSPFLIKGAYSVDGVILIQCIAGLTSLFILSIGAFGSHILINYLGSIKISGTSLSVLLFTLFFFFTENMIIRFGLLYSSFDPKVDMDGVRELGRNLAQISPFHSGGQFVSNSLLSTGYSVDLHFILPIGIIIIILGYVFGRKIYLDIFLKE